MANPQSLPPGRPKRSDAEQAMRLSIDRRRFLMQGLLGAGTLACGALRPAASALAQQRPAYRIQLDTITKGLEGKPYDGKKCYTQARAGIVPREGSDPRIVVTMSPLLLTGSDVYYELHEMHSD